MHRCSYNAINGVPACGSGFYLDKLARRAWGFSGFVVSDCYALEADTFMRYINVRSCFCTRARQSELQGRSGYRRS
jgi:beta-glucosidase-like glycosyl hydrolase